MEPKAKVRYVLSVRDDGRPQDVLTGRRVVDVVNTETHRTRTGLLFEHAYGYAFIGGKRRPVKALRLAGSLQPWWDCEWEGGEE